MRELVLKTRFFGKVTVSPATDCLEWAGRRNPDGYGNFWFEEVDD